MMVTLIFIMMMMLMMMIAMMMMIGFVPQCDQSMSAFFIERAEPWWFYPKTH